MTARERNTARREAFEAVLADLRELLALAQIGLGSQYCLGLELAIAHLEGRIEGTRDLMSGRGPDRDERG